MTRLTVPATAPGGRQVAVALDVTATVTGEVTPAPMLAGVNAGPVGTESGGQAITNHVKTFPAMKITRVFGPPGKGIPAWGGTTLQAVPAGVIPHVSFKDWDMAAVLTWADAIPPGRAEVWLTYNHEPEGDMDPAVYRQRWVALADALAGHPARPRLRLVPIHTQYWSRHKGQWTDWWPAGAGTDYIGWDCYNEVGPDRYEDPATFVELPIRAAAQAGVPLVIPELGAVRTSTDPDGTGRAAWILAVADRLQAAGCRAASWWCAKGTNGLSYHLDTDPAGVAAWRYITTR